MRRDAFGVLGVLVVMTVRGALLWLLVPIGTFIWVLTLEGARRPPVSLGAFLSWLDNNLAYGLVHRPMTPLFPTAPVKWIPASERSIVTHRISKWELLWVGRSGADYPRAA